MAALAIGQGVSLEGLALADTSYAPPYANALDNLVHLAHNVRVGALHAASL